MILTSKLWKSLLWYREATCSTYEWSCWWISGSKTTDSVELLGAFVMNLGNSIISLTSSITDTLLDLIDLSCLEPMDSDWFVFWWVSCLLILRCATISQRRRESTSTCQRTSLPLFSACRSTQSFSWLAYSSHPLLLPVLMDLPILPAWLDALSSITVSQNVCNVHAIETYVWDLFWPSEILWTVVSTDVLQATYQSKTNNLWVLHSFHLFLSPW